MSLLKTGLMIFSVSVLFHCTESPFGEEKISPPNRRVSGRVVLNDHQNPQTTHVWLEGFNLTVAVAEDGTFHFSLPSRNLQAAPGGVTGAFRLYFYISNYYLTSRVLATRGGELLYTNDDISPKGEIRDPVVLEKFLNIRTTAAPNPIRAADSPKLSIRCIFTAVSDTVEIFFPFQYNQVFNPVIFRDTDSDDFYVFETTSIDDRNSERIKIHDDPVVLSMELTLKPGRNLPPGRYSILPYFFIRQEQIPESLWQSLGPGIENVYENYMKIPRLIQSDTLTVL